MITVRKQRLILKVLRRVGIALILISMVLWQIYREMVPIYHWDNLGLIATIGSHFGYPVDIRVSARGTDASQPIWVSLEITVLPKRYPRMPLDSMPPEPMSSYPWIATRFSKPFSSQFRRADGTLTDILPMDWYDEKFVDWSEDGLGILPKYIPADIPSIAPGERWIYSNIPHAVLLAALRAVLWSVIPIILIVVLTIESRWVNAWWGRCENCDYDLTKTEGNICPECGERRVSNGCWE